MFQSLCCVSKVFVIFSSDFFQSTRSLHMCACMEASRLQWSLIPKLCRSNCVWPCCIPCNRVWLRLLSIWYDITLRLPQKPGLHCRRLTAKQVSYYCGVGKLQTEHNLITAAWQTHVHLHRHVSVLWVTLAFCVKCKCVCVLWKSACPSKCEHVFVLALGFQERHVYCISKYGSLDPPVNSFCLMCICL